MVFTTIQKFFPEERGDRHPTLSERRNIVVIADEAHRSQYDFVDGYARHMRDALPRASFVGFTGTPIELQDANTRAVFGDYISVYDIRKSVEDRATVPIYFESRLARLSLDDTEKPTIDPQFEEVTEGEEVERREKLKTKWAQLEAVVGTEKRVREVAEDIVAHFDQRLEVLDGKAMVVCMSRRICVDLYRELVRLRPQWHHDDDHRGEIKVVMTGSASDPVEWQQHFRNKSRRETLAKRFRDPGRSPANRARARYVADWVRRPQPSHHVCRQTDARSRSDAGHRPGSIACSGTSPAASSSTISAWPTSSRRPSLPTPRAAVPGRLRSTRRRAVAVMLEKYEVCCGLFHGFDRALWTSGTQQQRLGLLPAAQEHILAQENGKDRCMTAVHQLSQAFALAVPDEETTRIRDDVGFFQAVRAALSKRSDGLPRPEEELDYAVRQIISRAVALRRCDGHICRRRIAEARHLHTLRGVPRRGPGNASSQPRRRASPEAPPGRGRHPPAQERRAGPLFRRNARADPAALRE